MFVGLVNWQDMTGSSVGQFMLQSVLALGISSAYSVMAAGVHVVLRVADLLTPTVEVNLCLDPGAAPTAYQIQLPGGGAFVSQVNMKTATAIE